MSDVVDVIGAGSIGQAIARRVSAGKHVLLADLRQDNADAAVEVLAVAGFEASTAVVDVSLGLSAPRRNGAPLCRPAGISPLRSLDPRRRPCPSAGRAER